MSTNPEIDRLTTAKGKLREKVESWDTWNLRAISLAGIAGVFLIITSFGFSRVNRKFVRASDDLDRAKEGQLSSDLQGKDVEIAGVNKLAGDANDSAGKANLKAAEANERAEASSKIAAEANARAEELKVQNLATETKLEEERKTRLELEKSIAPRTLEIISTQDDRATFATLKPFAGIKVIFDMLPDAESQRAASTIASLIELADWKTSGVTVTSDINTGFFDGVIVSPPMRIMTKDSNREELEAAWRSRAAAEALVAILVSQNWKARVQPLQGAGKMDTNTIKITVGLKPNPYFQPNMVRYLGDDPNKK